MRPKHWLYTVPLRLRSLFRGCRVDLELDEELQYHLEQKTHEYIRKGLGPEEARYAALREFGGVTQAKEKCRDTRRVSWIQDLIQDVRYGARMLRKAPGFTAVAVLTLALGIGANTAIFSLVSGVLLRPLPYRDPARLVTIWEKDDLGHPGNTTFATYTDWKAMSKSFEELALYSSWQPTLTGSSDPEQLSGLRVTNNYFRTLGIRPALGRDFRSEEDTPSSNKVVILGHGLWERRFNSDPNIVGKTISLNTVSYVVAGVLPANFQSLMSMDPRGSAVEIWRVLGYDASQPWACRTCHHLVAIGRLRPGVALAQANAEMGTISAALWKAYPHAAPRAAAWSGEYHALCAVSRCDTCSAGCLRQSGKSVAGPRYPPRPGNCGTHRAGRRSRPNRPAVAHGELLAGIARRYGGADAGVLDAEAFSGPRYR
jgi:putative ABC transport system permease protein